MRGKPSGQRSLIFLFAEKVLQLGAIAVVTVILLRSLGPERYGYLGAATAILAMALPLATFGQLTVTRYISTQEFSTRTLVRLAALLSAGSSMVAAIAMVALSISPLWGSGPTPNLILILALAVLSRPISSVDTFFQAFRKNSVAAIARSAALVLGTALRVWIALTSQSLDQLAWVIVLENLLAGIFLAGAYFVLRGRSPQTAMSGRPTKIPYGSIVVQSWPLLISGLAVILYMRVSQPLLLLLSDPAEVGFYSAATNLTDAFAFIPTILLTILLPILVRLHTHDRDAYFARLQRAYESAVGLAILFSVACLVLGPFAINLLYGEAYAESGQVVQILALAIPFVFLGVLRNISIVTEGFHRETLLGSLLAVGVAIFLNIILIPEFGAQGAAWAAVCAHIVNGYLAFSLFRSTRASFASLSTALIPWWAIPSLVRALRSRRL